MGVRQVTIDGELAKDVDVMAEALGYDSIEYYIMDMLRRDLEQKEEILMLVDSMENTESNE